MPQVIPVIGITGPARSGKDTVANFIVAARGGYRYSFADPIREMLKPLGIDMSDPYWQARKEDNIAALGASPRKLMQTLGTEWGRHLINDNLWVLLAHQRLLQAGPGMVIADVRFENEARWVRAMGGRIIHIERPDAMKVREHASEAGVERDAADMQLFNTGTLSQLQDAVREMLDVTKT